MSTDGARMMFIDRIRLIVLTSTVFTFSGCQTYDANSALKIEPLPQVDDCFTELSPGGNVIANKFEGVFFFNGNCQGKMRALTKQSFQSNLSIASGSDISQQSSIYQDGDRIGFKLDNDFRELGRMSDGVFQINRDVKFDLLQEDEFGNSQVWEYGQTSAFEASKETILVYL
jgi:hypothetical protein